MDIEVIKRSSYIAIAVIILTLTGVFGTFSGRNVVQGVIALDTLSLIFMLGLTAYLGIRHLEGGARVRVAWVGTVASLLSRKDAPEMTVSLQLIGAGMVASLVTGMALVVMIVIETFIAHQDMIFMFRNYSRLIGSVATFGYGEEQFVVGIVLLLGFSLLVGALMGVLLSLSSRTQTTILGSFGVIIIMGLMSSQINRVITLPDALALCVAFGGGYLLAHRLKARHSLRRIATGMVPGAVVGIVLLVLVGLEAFATGGIFHTRTVPQIIASNGDNPLSMLLVFALVGGVGGMLTIASRTIHNSGMFFLATLLCLGILNLGERMTATSALLIGVVYAIGLWFVPHLGRYAEDRFEVTPRGEQKTVQRLSGVVGLFIVLIAPMFLSQYITNVLDLVMLYIIMGIGLNVMVGFAGLLDLGYVASFAIGAYTSALLTTSNIITTGCAPIINRAAEVFGLEDAPDRVAAITAHIEGILAAGRSIPSSAPDFIQLCSSPVMQGWDGTGILTFWAAWPVAILVSASTGMALGVPVLRLRGDYLAIVTLGFGEITRVLTRSNMAKPLLGASQGISPVPYPVLDLTGINPSWYFEMSDASSIYYLYVFAVLVAAFVAFQLVDKRLGRAWRAMKADEDVAEAMGVHLVKTKLLAFGISSAFAGLGGAIFAAQLRGIFPDSFTILVSINVLSLIIIGGLGSVKGVFFGALILVGLPEALRELQDYRLLAFGVLLVTVMLMKPEGLLPPKPPQLSERIQQTSPKPMPEGAD